MENYVGRKCKGFSFESETDGIEWSPMMEHHIGEIGEITIQYKNSALVQFEGYNWDYPISLIEQHLIEDEIFGRPTVVDNGEKLDIQGIASIPEIPQLGEGVEMEVSNDDITWRTRNIIAQMQDGWYIINDGTIWKYARPIQEVKKYTKEELVKIVGHDFEII
jgi:hypothetical protein